MVQGLGTTKVRKLALGPTSTDPVRSGCGWAGTMLPVKERIFGHPNSYNKASRRLVSYDSYEGVLIVGVEGPKQNS